MVSVSRPAMIIAQVCLVAPIIGLTYNIVRKADKYVALR